MEIINGLHNLRPRHRGCVLTVGNFDGVHRGHRALIDSLCDEAQALGVPSMLMTFEPQPREFFAGEKLPARLTRFREKVHLLKQTRLDRLLCLPFNERTANIEADWFAGEFIVDKVGAKHVVIGDDFRFGRGREGDLALFQKYGDKLGYRVSAMSTLLQGKQRINSTLIRQTLAAGEFPRPPQCWATSTSLWGGSSMGGSWEDSWMCRRRTFGCSAIERLWREFIASPWRALVSKSVKVLPTLVCVRR